MWKYAFDTFSLCVTCTHIQFQFQLRVFSFFDEQLGRRKRKFYYSHWYYLKTTVRFSSFRRIYIDLIEFSLIVSLLVDNAVNRTDRMQQYAVQKRKMKISSSRFHSQLKNRAAEMLQSEVSINICAYLCNIRWSVDT